MAKPKLISFDICPFVQRSVITLREKGAPYDIEYIDLRNKPDWFLKISPLGKVPVLLVDDTPLFESAVINEFLDETTGETRLHPTDPLERAKHRGWIEFASTALGAQYQLMMSKTEEEVTERHDALRKLLARVEDEVVGPFFAGDTMHLVDTAFAPLLQRIQWLEDIKSLGTLDGLPKLSAWKDALLARESVQGSLVEDVVERAHGYLKQGEGYFGQQLAA